MHRVSSELRNIQEPDSRGDIKKQCISVSHNAYVTDWKPPGRKRYGGPRLYIAHLYLQKASFTRSSCVEHDSMQTSDSFECMHIGSNNDVIQSPQRAWIADDSCGSDDFVESGQSESGTTETSLSNPVRNEKDAVRDIYRRHQSLRSDYGYSCYTHLVLRRHHGCYSAGASRRYEVSDN